MTDFYRLKLPNFFAKDTAQVNILNAIDILAICPKAFNSYRPTIPTFVFCRFSFRKDKAKSVGL